MEILSGHYRLQETMDLRKYLCMHPGCNHVASKLSKIDIISEYLVPILGHLYTKIQ